jgi:hypothetical protein
MAPQHMDPTDPDPQHNFFFYLLVHVNGAQVDHERVLAREGLIQRLLNYKDKKPLT